MAGVLRVPGPAVHLGLHDGQTEAANRESGDAESLPEDTLLPRARPATWCGPQPPGETGPALPQESSQGGQGQHWIRCRIKLKVNCYNVIRFQIDLKLR